MCYISGDAVTYALWCSLSLCRLRTLHFVEFVLPGRVAQLVMCLTTDACLIADPGVASSIPAPHFRGDWS